MNSLQAIIFDLDGVLVDTTAYHYRAWEKIADRLGVNFGPEQMEGFLGRRRRDCLLDLAGHAVLTEAEISRYLELKDKFYFEQASGMSQEDLLPGVLTFVQSARDHHLKLGVASSSANARFALKKTGLSRYMDAIGDGLTVQRSKPAPDIFVWVAGALGVGPIETAVIEDSRVGIEAAKTAGFYVVGVGSKSANLDADMEITDLSRIRVEDLIAQFAE